MADIEIPELDVPFVFNRRATAVPGDLRPLWRMNLVLLLLRKCCRGGKSSFARLHVLSWASLSPENRSLLVRVLDEEEMVESLVVRVEPSLNRAVDFAIGEGLVRRVSGDRYELTPTGVARADALFEAEECLNEEKAFVEQIGRRVTEGLVNELFAH
ncbi:MAG: hypothetical protein GY854_10520 [Deltaproteobacteria bacterium]|nr:hypothetical protein [Deltaproteobacteria bacterium]